MKISYNWLNEYVNIELDASTLADELTIHGLEVDEVTKTGSTFEGVFIGEIKDVRPHPNADRLQLCDVDLGNGNSPVQIVCGAPNVETGQKVPVATIGTELPVKLDSGANLVIKKAKLRGEISTGMICAEDELGIGEDHSGIMVLDPYLKPGTPFSDIFSPTRDYTIDIELTPNRPDAACHIGVARDIAAFSGKSLQKPLVNIPESAGDLSDILNISIENPEKCHRYVGLLIKNATVQESPKWLKSRLKSIGIRPVNAVVDATNFVLHEMGQPLHAFDFDTISGHRITVKDFDHEVSFETLDHVKRTVPPGTLFICDADAPIAIAGIMGGVDSEISHQTKHILIESAYFAPAGIRRSAKKLGLQTDASYRFERGIDPNMTLEAAYRCAHLIAELTGGELIEGYQDVHPVSTAPQKLRLRTSYVNRLLGTKLTTNEIAEILKRLELTVTKQTTDAISVAIPTFRPDLEREVDLVEEVGRIYDYNNIRVPTSFSVTELKPLHEQEKLQNQLKDLLKGHAFREIYTNSLLSEEDALLYAGESDIIHTLNPISKDQAVLRTSLLHGFLKAVSYNEKRGETNIRFFELGHVFNHTEKGTYFEGYEERILFSLGIAGMKQKEHWLTSPENYNIFDLKAHIKPLFQQLGIAEEVEETTTDDIHQLIYTLDKKPFGTLNRITPDILDAYEIDIPVYFAEFSFDVLNAFNERQSAGRRYRPVPKFPAFDFDLALVVDQQIPAGELMNCIEKTADKRLVSMDIFDVFEGESIGKEHKSIAFRLKFLDTEKTLTIDEVQPEIDRILKVLEKKFNATLRSK